MWLDYLSAFGPLILAAALIVVTWKYTRATQKMADVIAKDYEIKISPIIEVTKGGTLSFLRYSGNVNFIHRGHYACYVRDINLYWFLQDHPENKCTKPLIISEIQLTPGQTVPIPVDLFEQYFRALDIDTTQRRYDIGTDIKILLEVEIAGPDKDFKKQRYQLP